MSIFVDYRDVFHQVNTNIVTRENIYFLCSRVEIRSIINKNRQFFFIFYAKIAVLMFEICRRTKNGAKNKMTFCIKRMTSGAYGSDDVCVVFKQ